MSVRWIELPFEMIRKSFISAPWSGCPAVWCDDDDDDDDDDADTDHDDSIYLHIYYSAN